MVFSNPEVSRLRVISDDVDMVETGTVVMDVGRVLGEIFVLANCVAPDAAVDVKGCIATVFPLSDVGSEI